jgi:hypothetical protein
MVQNWSLLTELMGQTGPTGLQGSTGVIGATGATGIFTFVGATGEVLYFDGTIVTGNTGFKYTPGNNVTLAGDFLPISDSRYSLGATGLRWGEIYVGHGTINIAGPSGSSAVGKIGTDDNSIVYTQSGFASPFINIGPSINTELAPGLIGGWQIGPIGTLGTNNYDLIAQQKLSTGGLTGSVYSLIRNPGSTGATGYTGPAGQNGVSGGLVLFIDSATATAPTSGTLSTTVNLGTQTNVTTSGDNATVLAGTFLTASSTLASPVIVSGYWDFNIYFSSATTSKVTYYADLYYVDSDGSSNPVLISAGNSASATKVTASTEGVYNYSLFVSGFTLPDLTHRIRARIYMVFGTGSQTAVMQFRDGTVSHIHTTLVSNPAIGATGPTGVQGSTGLMGATGSQGIQGVTGPTGPGQNFVSSYNFWVSTNGNDTTGNGSVINPYASISKALVAASSIPDTIQVNIQLYSGTYTENVSITRNGTYITGLGRIEDAVIIGNVTFGVVTTNALAVGMYGVYISGTVGITGGTSSASGATYSLIDCVVDLSSVSGNGITASKTQSGNSSIQLTNVSVTTSNGTPLVLDTVRALINQCQLGVIGTDSCLTTTGNATATCSSSTFISYANSAASSALISINNTTATGTAFSFDACNFKYVYGVTGTNKCAINFNNSQSLLNSNQFTNCTFNVFGSFNNYVIQRNGAGTLGIYWGINTATPSLLPASGGGLTYTNLGVLNNVIGPTGSVGATGVTGATGKTGPTGPAGTNGTNGSTGATGYTGPGGAWKALITAPTSKTFAASDAGNLYTVSGSGTLTLAAGTLATNEFVILKNAGNTTITLSGATGATGLYGATGSANGGTVFVYNNGGLYAY